MCRVYPCHAPFSILEDLRARIARIEGVCARHGSLPFGLDPIDRHLPGGGLAAGALHEMAGSPDLADDASATIFLAGILARIEGPVFWCLRWRDLFAPALHLAGLHPDRVIHVEAARTCSTASARCSRTFILKVEVGSPLLELTRVLRGSGEAVLLQHATTSPQREKLRIVFDADGKGIG